MTLCDSMDCSPPGSSVHGILQARILECVAISFSSGIFAMASVKKKIWHFLKDKDSHHGDTVIPLLGMYPQRTENRSSNKNLYTNAHSSTIHTTAKTRKQPKHPVTAEWIKMMWYVYTVEHYSTIEKNVIVSFAATRMGLEIITLSEVSSTDKNKYTISLIRGI